jgi:ATP-dependent helicase/nuclease subunit A
VPQADKAALGEALHRVLEWALAPQRQGRSIEALAQAAARSFALSELQQQDLLQATRAILTSAECAPFFDASNLLWAGNEVAVHHQGQDLRIDRLVCRLEAGRRTWWIIDYKLHQAPDRDEGYREQLTSYAKAVTGMQPEDQVRCAFITGQGRLIELEYF